MIIPKDTKPAKEFQGIPLDTMDWVENLLSGSFSGMLQNEFNCLYQCEL